MRTILGVTVILALSFVLGGCVDITTIPTQIEAGDNVERVNTDEGTNDTGGL